MGDKSAIEWTDATWNPIVGCSLVSPGCTNCYAMRWAHSGMKPVKHYAGTTYEDNGAWTGKINSAPDHIWLAPLGWKKPRRIFVNSMGDVFHEKVPDAWIDRLFAIMALCPQHTFQILTKRSKRMHEYLTLRSPVGIVSSWSKANEPGSLPITQQEVDARLDPSATEGQRALFHANPPVFPLRNVWLGVSCEDQRRADERIPDLLDTPAAVRFVSAEPLLGPIDFTDITHSMDDFADCGGHPDPHWPLDSHDHTRLDALQGLYIGEAKSPIGTLLGNTDAGLRTEFRKGLDWIIAGGESGRDARPMHPDWVRGIRDQCAAAGTAFFFKQWGEWSCWEETQPWIPEKGCALTKDGRKFTDARMIARSPDETQFCLMQRVGKKRAGRLLDGLEHNGYPG